MNYQIAMVYLSRENVQKQIDELDRMINNMKRQLSSIVQEYGYDNVKEFYSDYYASKGEYEDYMQESENWEKKQSGKSEDSSRISKQMKNNQRMTNEPKISKCANSREASRER